MRFTGSVGGISVATLLLVCGVVGTLAGAAAGQQPASSNGDSTIAIRMMDASAPAMTATQVAPAAGERPSSATGGAPAVSEKPSAEPAKATSSSTLPAPGSAKPAADEGLKPIPAAADGGPVEIEAAIFKGVSPGVSSGADLQKAWGPPKETRKLNAMVQHLYAIEPFDRVEVSCVQDKVTSIVIRFEKAFPVATVAQQLELTRVRPVLISNELGEILGQSYPERGVVLAFEPGSTPAKPSMKVAQIILEPITAEPFVLRAETNLDVFPKIALQDLDQALKVQAGNVRAHWLRTRVLAATGDVEKALAESAEASRLEPENAQYRVTRAQVLGQAGRFADAIREAEKALQDSERRPHVKARAVCLLGDLIASSPAPDYKQALARHSEAIKLADGLADDPHPAIRLAAKEVLIDAHLGAAHDIAWGNWKEKERAITRWLDRAAELADDLVQHDGGNEAYRFHVSNRALAACVGARGAVDPTPWTEGTVRIGRALVAATEDPIRKAQYQWDLGMALYDALQVYQVRGDHNAAMKYGEMAIEYLEQGQQKNSPASQYLLGRLYFRMGAVYALRDQNHRVATSWFDKAIPLLDKPLPQEARADLGRHGETFVSMGVSYWEIGARDKGLALTQRGVGLMEQAVKQGLLEESGLAVANGNLAVMRRQFGPSDGAERLENMAGRPQKTIQK